MPTHIITGANRGIGLEMARQLTTRGDSVIALVRNSHPSLDSLPGIKVLDNVDVTDDNALNEISRRLEGHEINTLIHNAGVLTQESLGRLNVEAIRFQFEVNALGPLRLTSALLPRLHAGAKIAIVTSRMGSIGDNSSGSRYGYRMSKAAVNMAGVSMARDLADRGISVALLHPGFVRTDMTGGRGLIDPPEAARGLIARIDALSLETSGSFWHANGERLPW